MTAPTSRAWLVARALAGCMAGNLSAAMAYGSDISRPEDRASTLGAVGAANRAS